MPRTLTFCLTVAAVAYAAGSPRLTLHAGTPSHLRIGQSSGVPQIDLAERLSAGQLRAINREVTKLQGSADGVHVSEKEGPGVVWITGTNFTQGIIDLEVRGRDVLQRSFLGVAFHGSDDNTYDAVYVRPFNFRATDPDRRQHAVQYVSLPDYDWPRLRKQFPEEFENPVDPSVVPTAWTRLRVLVKGTTILVYVGEGMSSPTLEIRKLSRQQGGLVGLWTGNNSDGDFAKLRITSIQ